MTKERLIGWLRTYASGNVGVAAHRDIMSRAADVLSTPIPMVLTCPKCGAQHIDKPQPEKGWTNPPHRSHECQACGTVWRPADVETVGVEAINTRGKADTWP
jgi:rubredoxin